MTNCETYYDADPECGNMFPPQCGAGGIGGKPRLSSLSWQLLESWRRWSKLVELNGAKTDRTIGTSEHHAAFERGNDLKGPRFRIGSTDPVRQVLNASAEERQHFTGDFG
jgi:hypothetical protein